MINLLILDSIFYTKSEAKAILEKCCAVLSFICQHHTEVTRSIIHKFQDFKPSLLYYLRKYRTEDSRNLFEAVESEEECIKESGRKKEATILIQATFRMYKQKCRWKIFKNGIIALQRLSRLLFYINIHFANCWLHLLQICRRRKKLAAVREIQLQEEQKFLQRLETVAERKREMERRYKLISKLHPYRLNSFLDWERETAARKIQTWWRNIRPDSVDLVKEVRLTTCVSHIIRNIL